MWRMTLTAEIVKGVEELVAQFSEGGGRAGYLACVIALSYWFTVYHLENVGSTRLWRGWLRKAISDYAYPVSIPPASPAWTNLTPTDRHDLLDGILAYHWTHREGRSSTCTAIACILPNNRSELACRFLDTASEMGVRRSSNWHAAHSALLLRS